MDDNSQATAIEGRAAFAAAALELVDGARNIALITQAFDPEVWDQEAFVDTLKRALLDMPTARLRVLVADPQAGASRAPRLLALAQRLTSRIEIRSRTGATPVRPEDECLIVDERHVLERPSPTHLIGSLHKDQGVIARQRLARFQQEWNEATPAPEFRDLRL